MTPAILTLAKAMATAKTEHDVRVIAEAMEGVLRVEGERHRTVPEAAQDGEVGVGIAQGSPEEGRAASGPLRRSGQIIQAKWGYCDPATGWWY